jgi:membrane complex biogenesis BtpA family protein
MPQLSFSQFTVIAALHLLPFPGSRHPDARPVSEITERALMNVRAAYENGVRALYVQDLGDTPVAPHVEPHTIAGVTTVGAAIRREFPDLVLGVCLMSHGAREPLAIAQAIGAQFVRLKVYVGAMVKAEGLLQGCAHEAIQYRAHIGAGDLAILADVSDRTGEPLGRMPPADEARQAATFGRADGLILTGKSFDESQAMLGEVRAAKLDAPLLLGGSATTETLAQIKSLCEGVIVSTAFKRIGGWTKQSLGADWDAARIRAFMEEAQRG